MSKPIPALAVTILSKFPYILHISALKIKKINTVNTQNPLSCHIVILSNSWVLDCHSPDKNYEIMGNNGLLTVNAYKD
jgi:hypothetical protein